MVSQYAARLVGGPFDGDQGYVYALVPEVWVWACGSPRRRCPAGGVHWSPVFDGVPAEKQAERYRLSEDHKPGDAFADYVYPDLAEPELLGAARELAHA